MEVKALSVLVILVSSTVTSSHIGYFAEYDEEYIDFTDMGSYNHGFQKNLNLGKNGLKPPGVVEEENIKITKYTYKNPDGVLDNENADYRDGSVSNQVRYRGKYPDDAISEVEVVETHRKYKSELESSFDEATSMKFLKRIVASLLRQMNVRGHVFGPGEAITIDLQAEISHSDFMILNKFAAVGSIEEPEKYLNQIDSIISNMLHVVAPPLSPEFFETIKDGMLNVLGVFLTPKNLLVFSLMVVFLLLLSTVLWKSRTSKSIYHVMTYGFIAMILISCVWSFVSMYEKAKAENYARVLQTRDMPTDCDFDRFGWWDSTKYYLRVHVFGYEDRCVVYHRETLVDPVWSVSPTEAISQTFATLVFSPAGYIGRKMGDFFNNASNAFPFFLRPFVLILLFVFVFLGVFRFKITTPLLSIEPAGFFNGGDRRNNMFPQVEPRHHHQIAEKPAAEIVKIKTRDACVDTSDFEEYLRSSSAANAREAGNSIPKLLPNSKRFFQQFFANRSSLIIVVLSGIINGLLVILDKTLRQVPYTMEDVDDDPLQMDLIG